MIVQFPEDRQKTARARAEGALSPKVVPRTTRPEQPDGLGSRQRPHQPTEVGGPSELAPEQAQRIRALSRDDLDRHEFRERDIDRRLREIRTEVANNPGIVSAVGAYLTAASGVHLLGF